jgi:phosphoribosylanthranilate isomerase
MTWIKICGTTNLEDALTAVNAGADALGFVFYDKSPRKIDPEAAREIVAKLPERVEKVGVFVNESAEKIASIADEAGLTAVQLHGEQHHLPGKQVTNRRVFLSIPASVVAFSWRKKGAVWGSFFALPDNLGAIFVDSATPQQPGGTGKTFNWREASAFISVMSQQYPIVVAGGLNPANVTEAIRILKPWGVDVASGVEAKPGKKDPEKVRAFISKVRRAEKSA